MEVDERSDGQRLDNFLLRECPGVPKTRLYRAIRKGEIRVDKGRARAERRLRIGQQVRIPPLQISDRPTSAAPKGWQERLEGSILFEDDALLAINKPTGIAVHGGSGLNFDLIETLRAMHGRWQKLELVHRLDRDTSGVLLLAKKPAALRTMHALFRQHKGVRKTYQALVLGRWSKSLSVVDAPLKRFELQSGERRVAVAADGKQSSSAFRVLELYPRCSFIEVEPFTGRTHQIRVHAAHSGHPVLGDEKYGNEAAEALARDLQLRRLFLHAASLRFRYVDHTIELEAPLGEELERTLEQARKR